ncbi:MAG: APC family permease [Coriobacteriaceae bacterium]|nr:APC family permease [Coriobacteriaceae bacterium]
MQTEEKKISLFKLVMFTVCSILVLDSLAIPSIIGVSSITIWLFTAVVFFIPYGLINAELGSTYPDDGGMISWIGRAFGECAAVVNAWFSWINVAFWMPAVFVTFTGWITLSYFPDANPWALAAAAIALSWIVVWIGIRGIELSVAVSDVAAVCKVAVVVILGVLGIAYVVANGPANDFSPPAFVPAFDDTLTYVPIIVYNLLGFELIASVASEIEDPQHNIPKMTIIGGALITALYVFGTFGILAAVPAEQVDTVSGFYDALHELTSVCGPAQGIVFNVVMVAALATLVSNMVSWGMGSVEMLESIGLEKYSKLLGHKNAKYGTNDYAYIIMGAISTVMIVFNFSLSGDANEIMWNLFSVGSFVFEVPYIFMFLAAWKLRKIDPDTPRVYEVPGGKAGLAICVALSTAGIVASLFFLVWVPFDPVFHGSIFIGTLICTIIGFRMYKKGSQQSS